MALHFKNSNSAKKKVVGQLRRTQMITTSGCGAIVDMPDYSVIMASSSYWDKRSPVLHEPNLERMLGVKKFKQPYVSENNDTTPSPDVPAFRFPLMHFCPECKRLMPYWGFDSADYSRKCRKCGKSLVPSRFIVACINGHLEDFPYKWWVHRGNLSACPDSRSNDKLKIEFSDKTGGLDSIRITCTSCGATRTMEGSLSKDALRGYHCRGCRPWLGMKSEHNDPKPCEAMMRGLQRGASNVYFSLTASALTLPPWSTKLRQQIQLKNEELKDLFSVPKDPKMIEAVVKALFFNLINNGTYSLEQILREIKLIYVDEAGNGDSVYKKQNLMEDEYSVFCLRDYEQQDDVQFHIESTRVSDFFDGLIDDVILVKRLREVLALRGFRRITPDQYTEGEDIFSGFNLDGDCVPPGTGEEDWLPAIEMLGEGLFVRLNEVVLNNWEEGKIGYYDRMKQRLSRSNLGCENFSPRYVLLHTLAHLLIRELSIECGYSGAAIKERIYSTYPGSEKKMAGILLYTSTSDSDGSLGGLVRNGLPETFERIFRNMLQNASWCSSDPVCITSKAQGYDSLNYAACHACTLLPETSCEMRNCLLDRCAVVGDLDGGLLDLPIR